MNTENPRGEIILYQTEDGRTNIDVKLENETVWLSKEQMSVLFERDRTVISRHIKNIFQEGELDEEMVCAKFAHSTPHGAIEGKTQTSNLEFYNLDVIISVGYRVKSQRGTQFRIWANTVLKDYLIKGYAVKNNLAQQKYDDLKAAHLQSSVVTRHEGRISALMPSNPSPRRLSGIFPQPILADFTSCNSPSTLTVTTLP